MTNKQNIKIAILNYPDSLQSAIYGLLEMFILANRIIDKEFVVDILTNFDIPNESYYTAIIIPPSISSKYYINPEEEIKKCILDQNNKNVIICSACAGTFILASTGLLNGKKATTHWELESTFNEMFPKVILDIDQTVINEQNIITAGGLMSWIDLGLYLISKLTNTSVMRKLGKQLVIDTGKRKQKYYQMFLPKFEHNDENIIKIQNYLEENYYKEINISDLPNIVFLTPRTFLRRFTKATGLRPNDYLQKLRIQKACELIESSDYSFEVISYKVGYEDISSFRKIFIRITGLTPKAFRKRFV